MQLGGGGTDGGGGDGDGGGGDGGGGDGDGGGGDGGGGDGGGGGGILQQHSHKGNLKSRYSQLVLVTVLPWGHATSHEFIQGGQTTAT